MAEQAPVAEKKVYRSPQHKLVRFFEKSRNQWKAKCLTAKATVRRLKNRAHWLKQSRDAWKNRSQDLARRVRELEAQTLEQQQDIETLKKNLRLPPLRAKTS